MWSLPTTTTESCLCPISLVTTDALVEGSLCGTKIGVTTHYSDA